MAATGQRFEKLAVLGLETEQVTLGVIFLDDERLRGYQDARRF